MKIYIAQINPTIGDWSGNMYLMQQSIMLALQNKCDVVVLPELATTGYPPRDLLYLSEFWEKEVNLRNELLAFITKHEQITVIFGGLHEVMLSGGRYARYNSAWIYDKHFGSRVVHKHLLPRYDVFDETRYFSPSEELYVPIPVFMKDHRGRNYEVLCDVLICEDIWNHRFVGNNNCNPATYNIDPITSLKQRGCYGPIFVLNSSPFWKGKIQLTQKLIENICMELNQPVIWCNQVGAHDDIITGGYSMVSIPTSVIHTNITTVATRRAKAFQEDSMIVRISDSYTQHSNLNEARDFTAPFIESVVINGTEVDAKDFDMWTFCAAIQLYMTDYKRRCGFERAVLGLSGGIDSSLTAWFAALIFGSENVTGINMPSPYSSPGSINDSKALANNLHIRYQTKDITETYLTVKRLFLSGGKQKFDNPVTDENIQPRVRGMILMAHSNEFAPCLVLTTGNKSEIAIGYCTLYGDTCGGLAVIADLWKTEVYKLARFINKYYESPIPESILIKPASAELKPDQFDIDSLPPYDILDSLLQRFVEQEMTPRQILIQKNISIDNRMINDIYTKYQCAEYKRQQMPPSPKLHKRSFGSGRRMPIARKVIKNDR